MFFLQTLRCLCGQYLGLCEFPAVMIRAVAPWKNITTRNLYSAKYQPRKHHSIGNNKTGFVNDFSRTERVLSRCSFFTPLDSHPFLLYYDGISYNDKNRSSPPTYLDPENQSKTQLAKTALSYYTGQWLVKKRLLSRAHERAFRCTKPGRIAIQKNTEF